MKPVVLPCVLLFFTGIAGAQSPCITMTGPQGIARPGEAVIFKAEVRAAVGRLAYKWTVSAGTVEKGQGTTELIVRTDASMDGTTLIASVEVEGLPSGCEKNASGTAAVRGIGCRLPLDEFGDIKPNDVRARLDNFFADLANNPDQIGFVILRVTEKDKFNAQNDRLQLVLKHARFRKFDKSRIWFSFEVSEEARTIFHRLPPDEAIPCDHCMLIKGGDL